MSSHFTWGKLRPGGVELHCPSLQQTRHSVLLMDGVNVSLESMYRLDDEALDPSDPLVEPGTLAALVLVTGDHQRLSQKL